MSLATTASSQNDDGDSAQTGRTQVVPYELETAGRQVTEKTADDTNPFTKCAGPTGPEGASCDPQNVMHERLRSERATRLATLT